MRRRGSEQTGKDSNPYLFPKCAKAGNVKAFREEIGHVKGMMPDWYRQDGMVDENEHMAAGTAESIIRKIGKRAGVEKAHPHRFRRTGATMALRAGMPIMTVSKLLGHESLETTQIYLDISEEELKQAHEKYVT